jgi:hypothetical protein
MARDAEFDLIANDKTGPGVGSAARKLDDFEKKAKNVTKRVENLPLGAIGGKLGNDLATGLLGKFAPVAGQLLPIIGGIGVAAAPLLGASIAGAITAGVGVGFAGIGIAVAAQDERVQAAFKGVTEGLKRQLFEAGGAFVQPAIDGLRIINKAVLGINLKAIFQDASRFVVPLANGIGEAITSLGDGIEKLVDNAGPAVDSLADGIAMIGQSLGDGLASLADNGESSADALRTLFAIISSSIDFVFTLVNALTELYEISQAIGGDMVLRLALKAMGYDLDETASAARRTGSGTFEAAGGIKQVQDAAEGASPPVKSLADQLRDASSAAQTLYSSQTSVGEALARLSSAIKDNGKTLDSNTEKGRANRQAVSNLASALTANYEASLRVNGVGPTTDAVAASNRESFIRLATQLTGSSRKARELADKLLGIPKTTNTKSNADTASANANVAEYKNRLDAIPRSITTTVYIKQVGKTGSFGAGGDYSGVGGFSAQAHFAAMNDGSQGTVGGPVQVTNNNDNKVTVLVDNKPQRTFMRRETSAMRFYDTRGRRYG